MSNLFLVRLNSIASPYFYNLEHTLNNFVYTINFQIGSDVVNQTINLVDTALVGSVPVNVTWYANYVGVSLVPVVSVQEYELYFYYPNFVGTMFYDPGTLFLLSSCFRSNAFSFLTFSFLFLFSFSFSFSFLFLFSFSFVPVLVLICSRSCSHLFPFLFSFSFSLPIACSYSLIFFVRFLCTGWRPNRYLQLRRWVKQYHNHCRRGTGPSLRAWCPLRCG